jgi:hypothetical protein
MFPLFAPNIKADPFNPIKEIPRPPIDILKINQGKYFNSILNKIANNGDERIVGINTINQYEILLDNKTISSGTSVVAI